MFKAGVVPKALETLTERTAEGEVEAIPTLPLLSIVNLVLVPTAVELAILNLLESEVSMPIVQKLRLP